LDLTGILELGMFFVVSFKNGAYFVIDDIDD